MTASDDKRLRAAWTPARRKKLALRLEYHRKRAASLGRAHEVIEVDDLVNSYIQFGNRCAYCARPGQRLQMDHVQALSRGGSHTLRNLAPACKRCNRAKNCYDALEWFKKQPWFCPLRWCLLLKIVFNPKKPKRLVLYTKVEKSILHKMAQRPCRNRAPENQSCTALKYFELGKNECLGCRARRILNSLLEVDVQA